MYEDRLSHAERLRLESLSQAIHMATMIHTVRPTLLSILSNAEQIEKWLRNAREDA